MPWRRGHGPSSARCERHEPRRHRHRGGARRRVDQCARVVDRTRRDRPARDGRVRGPRCGTHRFHAHPARGRARPAGHGEPWRTPCSPPRRRHDHVAPRGGRGRARGCASGARRSGTRRSRCRSRRHRRRPARPVSGREDAGRRRGCAPVTGRDARRRGHGGRTDGTGEPRPGRRVAQREFALEADPDRWRGPCRRQSHVARRRGGACRPDRHGPGRIAARRSVRGRGRRVDSRGAAASRREGLLRALFGVRLLDLHGGTTKPQRFAWMLGACIASDLDALHASGALAAGTPIRLTGPGSVPAAWAVVLAAAGHAASIVSPSDAERGFIAGVLAMERRRRALIAPGALS